MGTWLPLTNQPSSFKPWPFYASTMLLLTDGTVMCAERGSPRWFQLAPDSKGNYANGTWSQLADGPTAPEDFASAVLKNGRVFVAGGEYQDGMEWDLLAAQVYNPVSNIWSVATVPPGWTYLWTNLGDAPSCTLPDGRILVGSINDNQTAIYNPDNNTWAKATETTAADKKNQSSSEETWTLLPDGTVLSVDCNGHPGAQKYLIATNEWIQIGPTSVVDLVEKDSIEIGPAILLPDGRVFCIGATGHTAFYHVPPVTSQTGSWTSGPDFPAQLGYPTIGAKDAPACLLPNGKVLCVAGPVDGVKDNYWAPMFFFEFDPVANSFALIPGPLTNPKEIAPYAARFLLLPSGQVLFSNGTDTMSIYDPGGAPTPTWLPSIIEIRDEKDVSVVTDLAVNTLFTLRGRQLNGLSQANSYGDDAQMATNYPLVRIRNNTTNDLVYCRTQNHSSMGVATGTTVQTTQFLVPSGIGVGASSLEVVANGIASAPVVVTIV